MTKLAEPVATNIIRILAQAMPPILVKIQNEYATIDGSGAIGSAPVAVPLPAIKNYYFGERAFLPNFPCIVVDPREATIDDKRFHFQWADYDHVIHLDILVVSDNEDIISRQLLRYARAVWEVLFGNQIDLAGNQIAAISLHPRRGGVSDLVKDPEDGLLYRGYKWLIEVHRFDDLS